MQTFDDDARTLGTLTPASREARTVTEIEQQKAERRRAGLRQLLARHELTPADLAELCDMPTANSIYNFLSGRSASLAMDLIERILARVSDETFESLAGLPPRRSRQLGARTKPGTPGPTVTVALEAAGGVWRSQDSLPAGRRTILPIPAGVPPLGPDAFGVRVRAPGAERLYHDGSVLVCRPLPVGHAALPPGCVVIVRRKRNAKSEITVRAFTIDDTHGWLWPRSTRPEHQTPIRVRLPLAGAIPGERGEIVTVLGVVIAAWQPEPIAFTL